MRIMKQADSQLTICLFRLDVFLPACVSWRTRRECQLICANLFVPRVRSIYRQRKARIKKLRNRIRQNTGNGTERKKVQSTQSPEMSRKKESESGIIPPRPGKRSIAARKNIGSKRRGLPMNGSSASNGSLEKRRKNVMPIRKIL